MTFEPRPNRSIDYHPCRYGASKILFRSPARRIRGDYVAFIGGTETFGRFVETPFPELVENATGVPSINLGCLRAGIDAFNTSPGLIDICSMAKVTVVQILGAASMSNRFFTVDPRHNERFMRASKLFKEIYPEVDFSEFDRTDHMLTALAQIGRDRLHLVRQEMQCAWVARMRTLLDQIDGKKVLLWLADHAPYSNETGGTICREPLFVDRAMLNAVAGHADALVEVVGNPQDITTGCGHLVFSDFERADAEEMLGPLVHDQCAQKLEPVLLSLLSDGAVPEVPSMMGEALMAC
ncbi:hypothetical protein AIOL_000498 [Candidatus Rhodobacter oscarellae]|uniref:DUF6473 domain-containing protein n=1 Tax=Candidatus Rhodobacter oscarellae TaxID=1675527 RepID=A0A0J9EC45_9RHOB|nr:DUF6473 family protein [Candidatus Rhodobacter lobularis]KMW60345.1 hypothetical protein AIOL_000498 [Candidatus Rhodobacter lobularis]